MNKLYLFSFILLNFLFSASYDAEGQSSPKPKKKQSGSKKVGRVIAPVGAPVISPKAGTQIKYVPGAESTESDENTVTHTTTPEAPVKNKKIRSFNTEILRSIPQLDSLVSGLKSDEEFVILLQATSKRGDYVLEEKMKLILSKGKEEQKFAGVNLTKLLDFPPFVLITPKSPMKEFFEKFLFMDKSQYVVLSSFSHFENSNFLKNLGISGNHFYKEIAGFIAYTKLQNSMPKAEPVSTTEASLVPSAP